MTELEITPELLLNAYASGIFPMADSRNDSELFWVDPEERGVLPLDGLHVSRSLKKAIRRSTLSVRLNSAFRDVMQACAKSAKNRENTWISNRIEELYTELNRLGFAHSVECWKDDELVGGLYGVCINGAFFGESMFHTVTNASKIALVYLVARLNAGGFTLLDTQFGTDHLRTLGVLEVPKSEYHKQLNAALHVRGAQFYKLPDDASVDTVLQLSTQTS